MVADVVKGNIGGGIVFGVFVVAADDHAFVVFVSVCFVYLFVCFVVFCGALFICLCCCS